jgi:hypothetical protein
MRRTRLGICGLAATLVAFAAAPATGSAQTATFVNPNMTRYPGTYVGKATPYPSSVSVAGLSGTVVDASVQLIAVEALGNLESMDLVLMGPGGQKVMLWSDACGSEPFEGRAYTFEDSGLGYLSDPGPCPAGTYKPSNYENPALDDLSAGGLGPAPPYLNSLSVFDGTPPNGTWSLFMFSDSSADVLTIGAWALTLTIQPPPATPTSQAAPASTSKKCKKKRGKRKKCKRKRR